VLPYLLRSCACRAHSAAPRHARLLRRQPYIATWAAACGFPRHLGATCQYCNSASYSPAALLPMTPRATYVLRCAALLPATPALYLLGGQCLGHLHRLPICRVRAGCTMPSRLLLTLGEPLSGYGWTGAGGAGGQLTQASLLGGRQHKARGETRAGSRRTSGRGASPHLSLLGGAVRRLRADSLTACLSAHLYYLPSPQDWRSST